MTKQLLPLEALGLLKGYILDSSSIYFDTLVKRFEIVETALKDYEYLKLVAKPLTDEEKKSINSVARRLKVLEIIKEKFVNITILMGCENLEEYNKHPLTMRKGRLTQEEFDLLREVLK